MCTHAPDRVSKDISTTTAATGTSSQLLDLMPKAVCTKEVWERRGSRPRSIRRYTRANPGMEGTLLADRTDKKRNYILPRAHKSLIAATVNAIYFLT